MHQQQMSRLSKREYYQQARKEQLFTRDMLFVGFLSFSATWWVMSNWLFYEVFALHTWFNALFLVIAPIFAAAALSTIIWGLPPLREGGTVPDLREQRSTTAQSQ